MREIKFRVWQDDVLTYLDRKMTGMRQLGFSDTHYIDLGEAGDQEKMDVMQYTGLKDKNGVEIYEGDILTELGMVKEVAWSDDGAGWTFIPRRQHYNYSATIEVIGNIYENPELLEAKQ